MSMQDREKPSSSYSLLESGIDSDRVQEVGDGLLQRNLIHAAATPSVVEFRQRGYTNTFLDDPIRFPEQTLKLVIDGLHQIHGQDALYDALLQRIPLEGAQPPYPGLDAVQSLVVLKHGELSEEELKDLR